ncbi:sensor domain-containing diguanylate cyclase [Acetobacter nitrogenifigens]|nr:diguanylate cyclase [Acetobacter nitrogenifigens]
MNTPLRPLFPDSNPPSNSGEMMDVLLASRRRWKSLTQLVADVIFETDEDGRFTFLDSGTTLGWAEHDLVGETCSRLLPFVDSVPGPNPFQTRAAIRGRRSWIRRADGTFACLLIYATPLQSPSGRHVGVRGLGIDVSDDANNNADLSIARLHSESIRRITLTMRSRPMFRLGVPPALEELGAMLGATGGILLARQAGCDAECAEQDILETGSRVSDDVVHRFPAKGSALDTRIESLLRDYEEGALTAPKVTQVEERDVIFCYSRIRYTTSAAMALWRDGLGVWTQDDANLADAALATFASAVEMEALNKALAQNARFDPLTGMLNRAGLIAEISRRLPRLDRERLCGALLIIGLDHFGEINAAQGFEAGDRTLQQVATYLRNAIRPTDLAGRLGGDIFGLWLDGADHFVAAERAETFCQNGVVVFLAAPTTLTFSVGLATRSWETGETIESLIDRASLAMRSVKLAGGARWHASLEESPP